MLTKTQERDQGRPTQNKLPPNKPTQDRSINRRITAFPLTPEDSGVDEVVLASIDGFAQSDADHQARIVAICDGVTDIVAALFNVSGRELRSPGRSMLAISRVRQIAMYVAHVTLRLTMRDVGLGFGRDRTTVLYACHQIEDLREEEEFDDIVARVEQVMAAAFGVGSGQGWR